MFAWRLVHSCVNIAQLPRRSPIVVVGHGQSPRSLWGPNWRPSKRRNWRTNLSLRSVDDNTGKVFSTTPQPSHTDKSCFFMRSCSCRVNGNPVRRRWCLRRRRSRETGACGACFTSRGSCWYSDSVYAESSEFRTFTFFFGQWVHGLIYLENWCPEHHSAA